MTSRPTMRQSTRRLKPNEAVATSFVLAENSRSVPTATAGGCPKTSTSMGVIKRSAADAGEADESADDQAAEGVEQGIRHVWAQCTRPPGRVLMPIAHKQRPVRHRPRPNVWWASAGSNKGPEGESGGWVAPSDSSAAVPDAKSRPRTNLVTNNNCFYRNAIPTYRRSMALCLVSISQSQFGISQSRVQTYNPARWSGIQEYLSE